MKKNYNIVLTVDEKDLSNFKKKELEIVDIIEIRLDLLSVKFIKTKLEKKINNLKKPVIFTIRKQKDSSLKSLEKISAETVFEILDKYNSRTNFLDIELNSESNFEKYPNSKFSKIYSFHDFKNTISKNKMKSFIKTKKQSKENCIFKFAVTPKNSKELADFLNNVRELSKKYAIAAIAMGELGIISRVFGDLYGSKLTYCCLKSPKAPGQISVESLKLLRKDF